MNYPLLLQLRIQDIKIFFLNQWIMVFFVFDNKELIEYPLFSQLIKWYIRHSKIEIDAFSKHFIVYHIFQDFH